MDHTDHMGLIRGGIRGPGGVWADFGAGSGAFTLALAELIGETGRIFALDLDRTSLHRLEEAMMSRFPFNDLQTLPADYTEVLELPPLDGVVMANALHFQRDKLPVLALIQRYLIPGGSLILVEYDTDRGNSWVPYPISFKSWKALADRAGFMRTDWLDSRPSRFLGRIYAALSISPG
jgi:ubiquinone/menaquinone biosynthesis C-methylase UbiE